MSLRWDVPSDKLDPQFCEDIDGLLGASAFHWVVTIGYRTFAEQKALYEKHLAGGPLAAPPGESAHNWGLAVDCAFIKDGQALSWDTSGAEFPWLWAAVLAHPRLHSGHSFQDDDHIEAYPAWNLKKAELKASGQWGKE